MSQTQTQTLFEKLGGRPAVETVVKDFYRRVLNDPHLSGFFENVDMDHQTRQQIAFLTAALGGPDNYRGRNMKDAHAHLGITEFHFDKVAGHLVDTLKAAGVPQADIDAVVELVAPLKADVVSA
ncbi:MAG: group 1 truncated hemoglobin [Planctomycetota bacterium]|nr:MAG: group 1 truncated hemoglobin [Planctomycetota bacterium]